jgi:hypothetical protein
MRKHLDPDSAPFQPVPYCRRQSGGPRVAGFGQKQEGQLLHACLFLFHFQIKTASMQF